MDAEKLYETLTGSSDDDDDDDAPRVGAREPANGAVHVVSLSATKVADGLIDPKLVLAWLLTALGAPGLFIGALVPVREAGALLPQLALARRVEAAPRRKIVWAAGSALQGVFALGIALAAVTLAGWAAGAAVLICLAGLSVARAACSLSHKDALARTIAKTRRGAIMGTGSTVGSVAVLGFGAALALGLIPLRPGAIAIAVAVAGLLWLAAAALFLLLAEAPRAPGDEKGEDEGVAALAAPLWSDPGFRRFVAVRALLTVTALAPPFLVMLSMAGGPQALGHLGPLVLASAGAAIVSSYVWGRLADRSSRQTLMAAGALGAVALGGAAATGLATGGLGGMAGAAAAVFLAQIAYAGVRTGRKVHLTDMAEDDERARYTALSNTLIGAVLVVGGLFGLLADIVGPAWVLAVFAACSAAAVLLAASLGEVQAPDEG